MFRPEHTNIGLPCCETVQGVACDWPPLLLLVVTLPCLCVLGPFTRPTQRLQAVDSQRVSDKQVTEAAVTCPQHPSQLLSRW